MIRIPAAAARQIARKYTESLGFELDVEYPVLVERFNVWRSTLKSKGSPVGEVVLDACDGVIDAGRTTAAEIIRARMEKADKREERRERGGIGKLPHLSDLPNTMGLGDSEELLAGLPDESVHLVFTSPPYYNVRPEYQEYLDYDDYLDKMRAVFREAIRTLHEGRFFVLNASMALLRRPTSRESSKRLAIPFDLHNVLASEGMEFIDDIHWVKPEGAGWVSGRGRNFILNRKPLAYKPVPVNEYILVYRKPSEHTLGWNISRHPDQEAVERSKILGDDFDRTNVWRISPSHAREHPAMFPKELPDRIIRYYSFENDVVLDPFAGTGTTALAAIDRKRRFVVFEKEEKYLDVLQKKLAADPRLDFGKIARINLPPWKGGVRPRLPGVR